MSNEPKWTWSTSYFINPKQEQVHPVWAADHINAIEAEVEKMKKDREDLELIIVSGHAGRLNKRLTEINERLVTEKKLQYDDFRSERNAMEDKISGLELEVERLRELVTTRNTSIHLRDEHIASLINQKESLKSDLDRCKAERDTMGLFPTSQQIVEMAEKFIGDYNGCNDHYVKRAYMIRMAQWVEEQFRTSQPKTNEG